MEENDPLFKKLQKIEALLAATDSQGEREAAEAAKERLQDRIYSNQPEPEVVEFKLLTAGSWYRKLLVAICRKYGLKPFRKPRQKHTTVMVLAEKDFFNRVVWPEFLEYSQVLEDFVEEITDRLIGKIYQTDE